MTYRFRDYTAEELQACGAAFVAAFGGARYRSGREWTAAVHTWFAAAAAEGCRGCCSALRTQEVVADLCHVTWDESEQTIRDIRWWERTLVAPFRVRLALESEWGKRGQPSHTVSLVLDDARKLALLRADAKVVLFASQNPANRDRLVANLAALRRASADQAPWLWIDASNDWFSEKPRPFAFECWADAPSPAASM